MESFQYLDWELIPYDEAYQRQKAIFDSTIKQKTENKLTENILIFCEHPHVITVGKNGLFSNLLYSPDFLKSNKVELFHTDRGGDITYHGPGQLVGYPIFDLDTFNLSLKSYIYLLEECIIKLLGLYGIPGERLKNATGVWLDVNQPDKSRKICAIGVKSSKYVTMHGFALNVNTDLKYFDFINPCGFKDRGVTSIQNELKQEIDYHLLKKQLIEIFFTHFNYKFT